MYGILSPCALLFDVLRTLTTATNCYDIFNATLILLILLLYDLRLTKGEFTELNINQPLVYCYVTEVSEDVLAARLSAQEEITPRSQEATHAAPGIVPKETEL